MGAFPGSVNKSEKGDGSSNGLDAPNLLARFGGLTRLVPYERATSAKWSSMREFFVMRHAGREVETDFQRRQSVCGADSR